MSAAAAAILDGMPGPRDLQRLDGGGETVIFAGRVQLFRFAEDDTAMRHVAAAVLRQLGFGNAEVAAVLGLTPNYVSTLHQRALREGTAGLVRPPGRPRETGAASWERARQWRAAGVRDAEIARRLGVNQSTVLRRLGRAHVQDPLPPAEPGPAEQPEPAVPVPPEPAQAPGAPGQPGPPAAAEPEGGEPAAAGEPGTGPRTVWSRYAGAMLLHAFGARAGAGGILQDAAGEDAQPGDVALLSAVSMCFALGAATTEQFKHLAAAEAGPLAGLSRLPDLRTLRPGLAAIADRADPLRLQRMFASAMLAADPVTSGVYYVDDHFVPYTGAKPAGKGWNSKRGRAEKGRADTHVTAHDGRAVCFTSGEPSGLSVTLPKALAELKKAVPAGTRIMLGFDRGGAYPQVFTHCREQGVHWVTYRRAPLAVPAVLPVITAVTAGGRRREITWAEEKVQLKDYGEARQITLFEHGKVALQILTSDFGACPAEILDWLKSRWREENFLKYASENYGIDKICDYAASIEANTKMTDNPPRKAANAAVRDAEKDLAAAERALAALLADPAVTPAAKNKAIPAASRKITAARKKLQAAIAARAGVPAKLPANQIDPEARTAVLRAGRRGLQMVLRLLAHNAEHWLAGCLNAYLRDEDEYRAITRETIIRGLAGTIAFTPAAITVILETPGQPRIARALAMVIDEINHTPPAIPGDNRPITYRIAQQARI
jgi:DNA-binding CsgD family transcriptional regulator